MLHSAGGHHHPPTLYNLGHGRGGGGGGGKSSAGFSAGAGKVCRRAVLGRDLGVCRTALRAVRRLSRARASPPETRPSFARPPPGKRRKLLLPLPLPSPLWSKFFFFFSFFSSLPAATGSPSPFPFTPPPSLSWTATRSRSAPALWSGAVLLQSGGTRTKAARVAAGQEEKRRQER